MKPKKNSKVNLEDKRTIFIQLGLVIALALVLFSFEYKSYDKIEIDLTERIVDDTPEELVQITKQPDVKPPPPPPQQQTIQLNIVDDDVEVDDELEIDVESDDDLEMEEYIPVDVEEEEEIVEEEIFQVVEQQPAYPGGDAARMKFLSKNIEYPQMAKESGIQGTVYVQFVVEKDGSVSDVQILRGIGGGCDEEAMRVVKMMPNWDPGKQRGKAVRVLFRVPIKFTLQG